MNTTEAAAVTPGGAKSDLPRRAIATLALIPLADWLFYGHEPGITIVLFVVVLALATAWANAATLDRRRAIASAPILAIALLPGIAAPGLLATLFAAGGLAVVALAATGRFRGSPERRIGDALWLFVPGLFRLVPDMIRSHALWRRRILGGITVGSIAAVLVPLAFASVFVALFAAANPVIDRWLAGIRLLDLLSGADIARIVFWFLTASLAWSFVAVRVRARSEDPAPGPALATAGTRADALLAAVFGRTAVAMSLAMFNLLFAVQTGLDGAYLWGGLELPEGISHAQYAHRGAYPLIAVALLSAAFVLIALRPGSETEGSPLVRMLVLLWIGQNVLLVVSAVLRLEFYVEAFSLTELRVAAFVWMGLVATGLALIVARILLAKSNRWLVGANLIALAATLYAACFVDWPAVIARYNVAHSFEIARSGPSLDVAYLCRLGGQVVPALDEFIVQTADKPFTKREDAKACVERKAYHHRYVMSDWRRWSVRNQRLAGYLGANRMLKRPGYTAPPSPED